MSLQVLVKLAENDLYHNESYEFLPPCTGLRTRIELICFKTKFLHNKNDHHVQVTIICIDTGGGPRKISYRYRIYRVNICWNYHHRHIDRHLLFFSILLESVPTESRCSSRAETINRYIFDTSIHKCMFHHIYISMDICMLFWIKSEVRHPLVGSESWLYEQNNMCL